MRTAVAFVTQIAVGDAIRIGAKAVMNRAVAHKSDAAGTLR